MMKINLVSKTGELKASGEIDYNRIADFSLVERHGKYYRFVSKESTLRVAKFAEIDAYSITEF